MHLLLASEWIEALPVATQWPRIIVSWPQEPKLHKGTSACDSMEPALSVVMHRELLSCTPKNISEAKVQDWPKQLDKDGWCRHGHRPWSP